MKVHNLLVTGSHTSSGEDIRLISSSVATINNAQNDRLNSIESITGSLVSKTGSFATTGSNVFIGTQTISGSLIPAVDNTYDLGSVTHQFRDLYLSSASLYIDGTKVLSSTTQELQITTDAGQSFKILEAGSDTITLQSNDGNITLATSGGGDVIMDPTNGIIALKGTTTIYAGNRILSSDGNNIHFGNGVVISGSLLATGTNLISGSAQILNGSGIISSSAQLPSGIVSSSSQVTGYGFSTTGSNTFQGTQVVTGSLFISENLIVAGSSSIQHISSSVVNIADNIITVNALNPSVRFGGLAVIDSGSNPQVSGSMLFDSVNNQWLFVHQNQDSVTSSVLLMGPETYNDLGNESYITANRLVKSTGIEHLTDSNISDTGTKVSINSNTEITGTFVATGTALVSGSAQITYGSISSIPSGIVSGSAQVIASLPSGTVSGSVQVDVMSTTNIARLATTGSNTFTSNQAVSGSVTSVGTGTSSSIRVNNTTTTTGRDWHLYSLNNGNFGLYNNTNEAYSYQITPSGDVTFNLSLTAQSGYFNKPFATNGTSLIVRQTTAGGNGNQDIGLVVDIQGANDLDRIANFRYYNGSTYTSRFSILRDGKVGVGYLTPTVPLQVSGTIATGDGDNGWGRFFYDTNVVKIQASKNGTDAIGLSFWTQSSGGGFSEKLNISGAGDSVFTGTGTFSGGGNTLVLKKGTGSPAIALAGTSDQATGLIEGVSGGGVKIYTSTGTLSSPSWSTKLLITPTEGVKFGPNAVSIIGTEGSHGYHYLYSAGNPKIYIEANGVVALLNPGGLAIGKSSASSALDVQAAGAAGIVLSADSNDTNNSGRLFFMRTGGEGWNIFNNAGKLSFRNSAIPGNTSGSERMYLDSSGNLLPGTDATYNLGSTSLRWNNVYTTDLHLSNEGKQNIVDGTWGDWTLQEGENDIFMLNNRSGEKFKIKLEKITQ